MSSHSGRTCRMSRNHGQKMLLREPLNPLLFPATELSWQGNPPHHISARGISSALTSFISFPCGSSKCRAYTRRQKSSTSQDHTHRCPARSRPRRKPPMPAKKSQKHTSQLLHQPRHAELVSQDVDGVLLDHVEIGLLRHPILVFGEGEFGRVPRPTHPRD